ncbi:PREDICTED: uncharacterized protein C1orf168 homolog [Elephantulus edwardii]|uniref:uncharacterized protein C1orf168 homolog n=1 Tax=Elephantulus edwardii TaxID=28737 RepID=UPI0003F0DFB1|nr:PREDICTED: uncharacterized protein C1orf168 homolog [Elephantulus edwardii]
MIFCVGAKVLLGFWDKTSNSCAIGYNWVKVLCEKQLSADADKKEGIKNFKELRAKFQNTIDTPLLSGPNKCPASVSQKSYITSVQPRQVLTNGKPFSSKPNQPSSSCPSGESRPLTLQNDKLTQSNQIQKCSTSPTSLKGASGSAINSRKASLLAEMNQPDNKVTTKEKVMVASNFRDKLRNWEKFSAQHSEKPSANLLANYGRRDFHLKEPKSLGCSPEKLMKRLGTNDSQILPSQRHLNVEPKPLACNEDSSTLLSQHDGKSLESHSPGRKSTGSSSPLISECEPASQVTEEQESIRNYQLPKTKPLPSVESLGPPPPKPPKPPVVNLQAFKKQAAALSKTQREAAVEDNLPPESTEFEEPHNYEATISYPRHSGNSINLCTAEEIADSTYDVRIEELQKLDESFLHQEGSPKHEVEDQDMKKKDSCKLESRKTEKDLVVSNRPKVSVLVNSLSNKEDNQELYEDVYRMKSNYSKLDLDGNETLRRLRHFFRKEKERFKMKRDKSKENVSEFSISMPDLEFRSPETVIYDDVDCPGRKSKEESKLKAWKPKFLLSKENKGKKSPDEPKRLPPINFFRTRNQNLEKKMDKEEKLFRKRFEYDKEIIVINTAVARSCNSRKGIFDLPITPGEELEVIDIAEQNLVICRNSEGKYGHVLIEHLDFK